MESVKIEKRLIQRIGVREWGLPSLAMPGKIWRSEISSTITCMVSHGLDCVAIETRPLEIIETGALSVLPDTWRAALWEYVKAWPNSGCCYGPFLAISEKERCDFIRSMASTLASSDDIGCRSIANNIGEFAAWGFELVSDTFGTRTGFR
jgi:hypothetical protein